MMRRTGHRATIETETRLRLPTHAHLNLTGLILLHLDEVAHDERPEALDGRTRQTAEGRKERGSEDAVEDCDGQDDHADNGRCHEGLLLRSLDEGIGVVWMGLDPTDEGRGAVHLACRVKSEEGSR